MRRPFPVSRLKTITRENVNRVVARFGLTEAEEVCNVLIGKGEGGTPLWALRHLNRARQLLSPPITQRAS